MFPPYKKKAHTPPSKKLWELPPEIHSNIHQPFHVGPKFNCFFLWLIHHVSYFKLIDLDGLGFVILPPDQISEELLREKTQLRNCSRSNRLDVVQRRKCFLLWRQVGKYRWKKSATTWSCWDSIFVRVPKGCNGTYVNLKLKCIMYPYLLFCVHRYIWMFPKNSGTPKSSILIGFSIIFTIHFGVPPFKETPIYTALHSRSWSPGNPHRFQSTNPRLCLHVLPRPKPPFAAAFA